jgi:hypothetical protein
VDAYSPGMTVSQFEIMVKIAHDLGLGTIQYRNSKLIHFQTTMRDSVWNK